MRTFFQILICTAISALPVLSGLASSSASGLLKNVSDSTFKSHESQRNIATYAATDDFQEGLLPTSTDPIDSVKFYIDKAQSVLAKIRETQNFISNLNDVSIFNLPVGIPKLVGGLNYDIGIYAIRLHPTHAEVDVVMQFEMPQNGKVLTFQAKGIKFTRAGGIVGDATLSLVGDYSVNFSGDKAQLILHGGLNGERTFATMDCDGFRGMGLDAEIKFSRNLLVPEDQNGNINDGNVNASFNVSLSNWNDLIAQVNLPSFQVASMPGMGFTIRDAVFDFSDLRNAPGVKFPANYNPDLADAQLVNLWRGVYVREMSVLLPPEFKSKNGTGRTSFSGYDLLIDNQGFTGTVAGENLIALTNGDMNGWSFSVDSIGVTFQKSQLVQAGFNGDIVIPVSEEKTPFHYDALINDGGNYLFRVASAKDMAFPLWQAGKVEIYESSFLEVKRVDKKFLPKANLHGRMAIQGKISEGGQGVQLADIRFENLQIQSVKPYLTLGNFSFGSEAASQAMAGFPISIENIGMRSLSPELTGLDFDLKLNLVGESSGAFAADAGLTIVGKLSSDGGTQRWRFDNVDVRQIGIDIDGGAFKFNGKLTFYKNDAIYGDGFNGIVNAEFVPKIKVKASAIFGNVKSERYWYADAMAEFSPAIPLFTGVAMNGFGGGAYHGMRMDNTGSGSALGATSSGIVYVPDTRSGLGIKAIIKLASSPSPQAFNAELTFEIAFFKGGGIRTISLNGNGFIATPGLDGNLQKLKEKTGKLVAAVKAAESKALENAGALASVVDSESSIDKVFGPIGSGAGDQGQISARMFISYDFENRVLHGNFSANLNVAGGILKGGGDAVLHFAPDVWYVYVGTPEQRFGLSIGIGPIRANADSYFMVGTKIPGSPPPPENVTKILGGKDYDYMKDLNAIGKGGGFAFGASFSVSTGDMQFLIFYASFSAGAGFDIMIKNYGDTYCEGSNKRIGINGWYANGQAYAYFQGSVGIKVRVFGKKKKIEIFEGGAAALLQAKLPNPFWMRGAVGGYFKVLGGLVKGRFNCEITIGRECKLIEKNEPENALEGLMVISQLTPGQGEKNVNVFTTPQAVFNMPVDKVFELPEDDVVKSFRIKLEGFRLSVDSKDIAGALEWNENHDVVAFRSIDVLPPTKQIKGVALISFEELENGVWKAVMDNGKLMTEKMEVSFNTGEAPNYIPLENVAYSYPVHGQTNFYRSETTEGYIKLKQGQPYLFSPGAEWKQLGRFTAASGKTADFNFTYVGQQVNFTIPSNLLNSQLYSFELLNVPAGKAGAVDRNVKQVTNKVNPDNTQLDTEIVGKKAEGAISELQDKAIFTAYFQSSQYNLFSEKINSLAVTETADYLIMDGNPYLQKLYSRVSGTEYFDLNEISGTIYSNSKPLIQMETVLATNKYFTSQVEPLVYNGYPLDGNITITNRVPTDLGVPPIRAIYIDQDAKAALTENDLVNGYKAPAVFKCEYIFNLSTFMFYDFVDIQAKVIQRYLNQSTIPARMFDIMARPFPRLDHATYSYKLKYTLPGTNKVTSEKIVTGNY